MELPKELQETARRLALVSDYYLPRVLNRGLDQAKLPAFLRPLLRTFLADSEQLRLLLPAVLLVHPVEDRFLTVDEAREFFAEIRQAMNWVFETVDQTMDQTVDQNVENQSG